jgi:hypothetical protein
MIRNLSRQPSSQIQLSKKISKAAWHTFVEKGKAMIAMLSAASETYFCNIFLFTLT